METEDEHGGHAQNLHDLQNYLSTFKKEIEPGDDILSHMDVDGSDVNDLYGSTAGASLQELGEVGVASQFSSGFYSEQGILDTPLSDDTPHQIQSIDATGEAHSKDKDLDSDQAQITSFGDSPLGQGISDIQTNPIAGSLIMTSLGDSLHPNGGKVIRIVSLDEDGQYLSLGDTSQMQILSQDLDLASEATDRVLTLQGSDSGGSTLPTSVLASTNGSAMVVTGSGDTMTTSNGGAKTSNQMLTLQASTDNSQPQIVALPQGAEALTAMSSLLNPDGTLNPDLGFQTITIMPHELCQGGGDMNYVLIMAQQDGSKEATQQLAQIIDLKQENHEFSEDLVEINGEVKRVLRVVPKKYLASNFGMQLVCDYCDYTSPKRYLLTRHMKSHSDERPHKCKECDRGFKTPASLMNHVNTHTGIRPHKCKNCDAAFTTSGELVRHIRYRHTFEKPHRCPSCDYASVELSKLKRHMRSHTGERPYKCPHCPYASPDTYKLKRHLRIHTGEKPYECDICHTRFTQSNSLKAHKLIHSGNKPVFQCKLCPTTCGRKTDLKIHFNKLHSEGSILECKKCGQMFSDRYSYKQHVRSHDFEKCYKCEHCDFIANTDRSFDAHAAIHSDGSKFECDTCHVTFNLKQSLDKHKQNCPLGEDLVSSKNKDSAEKSQGYKASQQNKMDILLGNESSSSSSMANSCPLASGTLHRNLLQDIKDGKLGHVPQVVIVHPDGSLEEISSKLPIGDKMNIDDLFTALSNNEKQQELESGSMVDNSEDRDSEDDGEGSDHTGQGSPVRTNHGKKDLTGADNDEETAGESSQCEASTQAELESDTETDFVDEGHRMDSLEPKDNKTSLADQFLNNSLSPSPLDHSEISTNMSDSMSDAMVAHISNDTMSVHVSTASSEALSSLIQQAMAPSDASSASSPPLATMLTTEHSGSQQYVVVKGYTCLSSEAGQPTLVNVAVDKDSLMKMLASLGSMTDGAGVQLLAGDIDSLSMDVKSNVISMTQEQLNDFVGLASMSSVTDVSSLEQTESSSLEETSQSTPALDDVPKGSTMLNRQHKFSTLSIDALSMGKSPHNVDSSLPKELLSPSITSQSKCSPPLPSASSLVPQADAFNSGLPVDQSESPLDPAESQNPGMSPAAEHYPDGSGAIDVGTEMFPDVTAIKTELSEQASQVHVSNCDSDSLGNVSLTIVSDVQVNSQVEEMSESVSMVEPIHSTEKQKRNSRKRSSGSAADPSLVMTGKRVRKALVKVSM